MLATIVKKCHRAAHARQRAPRKSHGKGIHSDDLHRINANNADASQHDAKRKKPGIYDTSQYDFLADKTFFGSNDLHFYGLAAPNLSILGSNPKEKAVPPYMDRAYRFLQSAYFGLKQASLEGKGYSVPHEVLIAMHPSEILAFNCAINRIKFDGGIKHPNGTLKDISRVTIDDLVDVTDRVIEKATSERDGFSGFRKMYNDDNAELHQISLKERLANLPNEVLLELVSVVRRPYRKIHDPHPEDTYGWTGADIYRKQIGYAMMAAWTKNMSTMRPPIFMPFK
ncbi:hypothetical protein HYX08_01610 [Candidatus Woesearchaeota archaeon]|nr:hypothetical protein [Candidatus Woesearchaeota archaeon]